MEKESRKRGREQETTERSESDRVAKKLDADGCRWGEGRENDEEEEMGRGVFDFPWLKGEGVMTEEEWKEAAAAATQEEETFLGSLGRWYGEEVGTGGGMPLLEEMTSSSTLSLVAEDLEDLLSLDLEESWDRDGIWASLLH